MKRPSKRFTVKLSYSSQFQEPGEKMANRVARRKNSEQLCWPKHRQKFILEEYFIDLLVEKVLKKKQC